MRLLSVLSALIVTAAACSSSDPPAPSGPTEPSPTIADPGPAIDGSISFGDRAAPTVFNTAFTNQNVFRKNFFKVMASLDDKTTRALAVTVVGVDLETATFPITFEPPASPRTGTDVPGVYVHRYGDAAGDMASGYGPVVIESFDDNVIIGHIERVVPHGGDESQTLVRNLKFRMPLKPATGG